MKKTLNKRTYSKLYKIYNLKVIEDCAQALGAKYKGRPVGSLGHVAAFSFCQDKIITTGGEGGMLVTNDRKTWEIAWSYKDHGKSFSKVFNQTHTPGYRWMHDHFGTNYRLTEMQSALGRVALTKLPSWLERRRKNARIFSDYFSRYDFLRITLPPLLLFHSYYKYYVFVKTEKLNEQWDRNRLMGEITSKGVPCFNTYAGEVYLDEAYNKAGLGPTNRCCIAKELGETCLQFLVHPTLHEEDIEDMCCKIEGILSNVTFR